MKNLKETATNLPEKPGCYVFKTKEKKIIYIGKAKNLKKRVSSYFSKKICKDKLIIENSVYLEYYITGTEVEALILENNLIKKHKPKYNINLKDDKTYPFIELTINDDFPGIYFSRKPVKKNSLYFGPYPSAGAVKRLISLIEKYFLLKTCKKSFKTIKRACLKYQINRCSAPCVKHISRENYNSSAKLAQMFLEGKYKLVEEKLHKEMLIYSENTEFEKAAEIRDILIEIKKFKSSQFADIKSDDNFDVIVFATKFNIAAVTIFYFKNGRLIDKSQYLLENEPDIFQTFLEQYFYNLKFSTDAYYLNIEPNNLKLIQNYLKERFKKNILIKIPQKGKFFHILKSAYLNCIEYISKQISYEDALKEMEITLHLTKMPAIIECIDISHSSGTFTVGSVVRFKNGVPDKNNYRKFKIKKTTGIDDFKSIGEVVQRHFDRLLKEKKQLPDLIVIDGGKGQLHAADFVMKQLKLNEKINLISIAKKEEIIFSKTISNGYKLNINYLFSKILIKIRDEAHRFAISYNRKLRKKSQLSTELTSINGIGKVKASKMLSKFKSIENIKTATDKELEEILSKKDISTIRQYFDGAKTAHS